MAALLSFSRRDAAALPLTERTVEEVIARTRTANLAQLLLAGVAVALCLLVGRATSGPVSWLFFGAGSLAMWGLLATALATWDHVRAATSLRVQAGAGIARCRDPQTFWRAHRGLFPYFSR